MKQNGFSLLSVLVASELLLAAAGLVAAGMLITSTTRINKLATSISSAVESVYAAEQAERALLVHSRRSYLHKVTGKPEHLHQQNKARRSFEALLSALEDHIGTEQESEVLKQASENASLYFKLLDQLESEQAGPDATMTTLNGALEDAQASLETLVQINYEQAQGLQQRVKAEDAVATRIGILVGAGIMLLVVTAFLLLERGLRQPLVHLKAQMKSLHVGELSPIEPSGPSEFREIASVFSDLVGRLREQRETQLRFLAGIAHDLRTPLNAIKLSTDCMEGENLDEEQRQTLKVIERQVRQLDQQVGDLLDTTRIEAGQLSLKRDEQDLTPIVESAAALFRGSSDRHTVTLSCTDEHVIVACDATRISQVLNNLLSNAIKYSPSGGDVAVTMTKTPGFAVITVNDEGIGIDDDDVSHIFEPFRRTAATRETIPGVGLGLSVAKRIIEAHEGTIQVSSRRGVGTTFTVRLPLKPAHSAQAPPASAGLPGQNPPSQPDLRQA